MRERWGVGLLWLRASHPRDFESKSKAAGKSPATTQTRKPHRPDKNYQVL
jgi:hypothetical protein